MFESIFPGMDPFIEDQRWIEFHTLLIGRMQNDLARLLVPQYVVKAEGYINLRLRPDVSILYGKPDSEPLAISTTQIAEATRLITPTLHEIDEQQRIEIYDDSGHLVTVIELLSPSNKGRHRDRYLANRDAILYSDTHLIEIDLLRGGECMEPATFTDGYMILVARAQADKPHQGELYEIDLREALPVIPVPLKPGDADVPLDLPTLFQQVYEAARYRLQLDYSQALATPCNPADQDWIEQIVATLQ